MSEANLGANFVGNPDAANILCEFYFNGSAKEVLCMLL